MTTAEKPEHVKQSLSLKDGSTEQLRRIECEELKKKPLDLLFEPVYMSHSHLQNIVSMETV